MALVPELRSVDEKARTIEFVASTEAPDRYKDVLRVSGWQTKNYMKNPVVLWAHQSDQPPIGKTLSIRTEAAPAALVQVVEFATKETSAFADQVFQLYRQKFLNAVSVGFRPLEPPEMIMDETGSWTGGFEFTSMELLELSAVPIPANPQAIARAIDGGLITVADVGRVFVDANLDFEARLAKLEREFAALKAGSKAAVCGDCGHPEEIHMQDGEPTNCQAPDCECEAYTPADEPEDEPVETLYELERLLLKGA